MAINAPYSARFPSASRGERCAYALFPVDRHLSKSNSDPITAAGDDYAEKAMPSRRAVHSRSRKYQPLVQTESATSEPRPED